MADGAPDEAEQAWRTAVIRALKGAPPETLVSHTRDGLAVQPLYPAAKTAGPGPWRDMSRTFGILPHADHPDPGTAAALARTDLENGATGLVLVGAGSQSARGFGIATADLPDLLDGIEVGGRALRLDVSSGHEPAAVGAVLARTGHDGFSPETLDLDVGLDPLGEGGALLAVVGSMRDRGLVGSLVRADGRPHHAAGASEGQELAAVLGAGVAALRALEPLGLEQARAALSFTVAADADQFLTTAKFRALRRLWAKVEIACGLPPRPMRLHAETAARMLARRDPQTNILRTTLAVAAAILGGADGVTVLPFTSALGLPDAFARRLARNTPLVLLAESHLGRVIDPAAGSGAYEALTADLAADAWLRFQALERAGGLAASIASGAWPAEIAATQAVRQADLASGAAVLVGVTRFIPQVEVSPPMLMPAVGVSDEIWGERL